jgi:hypothetical protein
VRLEWLGEGLAVRSGEMIAAHWVNEPVAKVSASRSLGAAPEIWSLHMEWRTLSMHQRANHIRVSEERP